jgi:4-amino-4-deoxy-L-arabinose transferase-like glycosyltransferase
MAAPAVSCGTLLGVSPGRLRRSFGRARETALLIGGTVFGIALFVFVVVIDTQFVASALERSESFALPAVVIGVVAALGTVLGAIWYRRRAADLGKVARRLLGFLGIAWAVAFVIAFVVTHPRGRNDEDATALEAGIVSYLLGILIAAAAFLPIALLRFSRPAAHKQSDRVRVMRVQDKEPFFVSSCDCGWVGPAYDETDPDAPEKAFRDARAHGTNVAPEVERTLV